MARNLYIMIHVHIFHHARLPQDFIFGITALIKFYSIYQH